jgi:hypothetical protein
MPRTRKMGLRQRKRYLASFSRDDETVDVTVRARSRPEAEQRAKMLVAEGWGTTLLQVRRESWLERRARQTAPSAGEHHRRIFAVTLVVGTLLVCAVVFLAAQASNVVA